MIEVVAEMRYSTIRINSITMTVESFPRRKNYLNDSGQIVNDPPKCNSILPYLFFNMLLSTFILYLRESFIASGLVGR